MGKLREKMLDGRTKWLKTTRDRDAWRVMIFYDKEHCTYIIIYVNRRSYRKASVYCTCVLSGGLRCPFLEESRNYCSSFKDIPVLRQIQNIALSPEGFQGERWGKATSEVSQERLKRANRVESPFWS